MHRNSDAPGASTRASTAGLVALARQLADLPVDLAAIAEDDPLRPVILRVAGANGEGPIGAFQAAIAHLPDAAELAARELSIDPKAEPTAAAVELPACPSLPAEARPDLELAAGAATWLDGYVRHARSVSPMTPDLFHESAALWLGATAIARRLKVPLPFGNIFPNLYILWVAPTTIFHKTTAMDVARGLARATFQHLLAPQEATPEALLSDLAGTLPARLEDMSQEEQDHWRKERDFAGQRALLVDEMSGLMASTGRDYNAGLLESDLRFYECDPRFTRSTRAQGRVTVRNVYVSMLAASTPRAMGPHLSSDRLWAMGWWPRFALLSPETDRPTWETPTATASDGIPESLVAPLRNLYARLPSAGWPDPAPAHTVMLREGVLPQWGAYSKALSYDLLTPDLDERLAGAYGRLPVHAVKVATILAAFDWGRDAGAPRIELAHLHRAMMITEAWRASAHRTLGASAVADENVKLSRIVRQIARGGLEGAGFNDLRRAMRDIPASELKRLVDDATTTGELEVIVAPPGPKGGRPSKRFRVPLQ